MELEVFKIKDVEELLNVSHTTVSRWIKDAQEKNNNLQLETIKNKISILKNEHNIAELNRLKEKAVKYRNKIGYEKVIVDSSIYSILGYSQLVELITSLQTQRTIPVKFTYLDKGADIWDNFVISNYGPDGNPTNYMDVETELLISNLDPICVRLKQYESVNIIDIGPGNGFKANKLIAKLTELNLKLRYISIDISKRMNEILKNNLREWHPDLSVITKEGDMDYLVIQDLLFNLNLNYPNSCNLILLLGSTIGNVFDRHRVFKNFYTSMTASDFLLIDNGLDTKSWRSNFDTISNSTYSPIIKWILENLGIEPEMYEQINRFDSRSGDRVSVLKLNKDLDLVFQIKDKTKIVAFREGDEITVWKHHSHTPKSFQEELEVAGFEVEHLSIYPDKSHIIVLCEAKNDL